MRHTEGRKRHDTRKRRESLRKRLGRVALQILARDGHVCAYCRAPATCLDHLTPRCRGGLDVPTNLVAACRPCNSARQSMSLPQWARYAAATRGLTFTARSIRRRARRPLCSTF